MKLLITSWPIARWLGVTKSPPSPGEEYIEVKVEGGPPLWWVIEPKLLKEKAL